MTTPTATSQRPHPAKFSDSVPEVLQDVVSTEQARLGRRLHVLDPMAGTGEIHGLAGDVSTVGVEIEPEWVFVMRRREISDDRPRSSLEVV